ncbi:YerC/YecD family TrpR-related protein [Candidatus Deianiraea vastatrix]|uniref:TrpR-like DNA binding trascriptional regulator n=1 Tax=Candidatus Deianiraea vastatrix TaxID=2163644 RepID=A0A5B8XE68_9RICK|nr:YerC/YecD family TrpR-related protein [Candidatus Deianiraea vastatrix]QED23608.1 Putative TrpR-like DNA binding trascriptional regulator [Candidatus Deianiraea vastatrix]
MKLEKILTAITNEKIMLNFLKDITTPQEFKALQERLDIVLLLNDGMSYAEISKKTGASTTTITRVARFLKQENYGGYRWILDNLL